jgi:CHAT domain-containing protein
LLNDAFTLENFIATQAKSPAETVHLATHAQFNPGAPDSSYIQFWHEQLSFAQMASLNWSDLELLILSACSTAFGSPEAELGFAGLATATGVETSVGSLWNVSDIGTLALMAEFYGQLTATPLRFEALRNAQLSLLRRNTRIENHQLLTQHHQLSLSEGFSTISPETFEHPFYWSSFMMVGNPWW